jgi:hypothetical protein
MTMGGKPGANYPGKTPLDDAKKFAAKLDADAGLKTGTGLTYLESPDAGHNEAAWQSVAPELLMFLYKK